VRSESLRSKWSRGLPTFGPFVQLASVGGVEILAHAGFDYVIIDLEHGAINFETAENMVRAANAQGITAIVRVLANRPELITAALNIGADGVHVPHVSTVEAALAVVRATKFGSLGNRGVCPSVRSADYSASANQAYYDRANEETLAIVSIEGQEGLSNLDEILKVEGISVVFVGPYDLSQSLGVTGEPNHPLVVDKVREVCEKAEAAGVVVGIFVETPESAQQWVRHGIRYCSLGVDAQIFYKASRSLADQVALEMVVGSS
jgi:4-hydroxy-2-oxoheptanedioate aldolase